MTETGETQIPFVPPDGDELSVELADIELGQPVTIWIRMTLDQLERVVEASLFNIETEIETSSFVQAATIEAQLQLDQSLQSGATEEEIRRRLSDSDDSLAQTESWTIIDLREDLSSLSTDDLVEDVLDGEYKIHPAGEYDGEITDDSVLETVTDHLDADDWPYRILEDGSDVFVRTAVEFDHGQEWDIAIHIEEQDDRCTIYSTYPVTVSAEMLPEVGALLVTENYDYINSAFEVEPTTGEISFRTKVLPANESFEDLLLENVFGMKSVFGDLDALVSD